MCKNSKGHPLTWAQLEHAIKRNFGGLESSKWNPFQEFKKRLNLPEEQLDRKEYDDQVGFLHYMYICFGLFFVMQSIFPLTRLGSLLILTAQDLL